MSSPSESPRETPGGSTPTDIPEEALQLLRGGGGPVVMSMQISTRPQDWAEPARRILQERGAWRRGR